VLHDYAPILGVNGREIGMDEIMVTGHRLIIRGLTVTDVDRAQPGEKNYPSRSARTFKAAGSHNLFWDMQITSRGSIPYGYSSYLGKGGGSVTKLRKHSAVSPGRGDENIFINLDIKNRAFGHALSWGRNNTLTFIGCDIEGKIRSTNEVYKETSGPAYENDFMTYYGEKLPRDVMLATGEGAFRSYPIPHHKGGSKAGTIKILDCQVTQMRSGSATSGSYNGQVFISNSTFTRNTAKNFAIPENSRVVNSQGDVRYCPLIHIKDGSHSVFDLTVLPSPADVKQHRVTVRNDFGFPKIAAILTGNGHKISLKAEEDLKLGDNPPVILVGIDKRGANGVVLRNDTELPIKLNENTSNCRIMTRGRVIANEGSNNRIERISPSAD
jgi:hypothetical protein